MSAYRVFKPACMLHDGALKSGLALAADLATGEITRIARADALSGPEAVETIALPGRVLLPGGVNTHSHAFQILLRGRSDDALSFRTWVDDHLYPLVVSIDREDLETACLLAFADMVRHGITTVGEFYYIHNTRDGQRLGNELDDVVIRAARRVGLRITLLRTLYDQGEKPGQRRFRETREQAVANTRALALAWKKDPFVSVQPAPHSLHGASADAILAAAELAEETDGRFHIHLAEQRADVDVAQRRYGTTPARALEKIGVVGPRLVIVHGVWLDGEEWRMLGDAGAGLAYNPSANLMLGDGITDIDAAVRAGVTVSLGCDGPGGNNKLDLFEEMRLTETLQRARLLRMGVLAAALPAEPCAAFTLGTRNGARNLGLQTGALAAGFAADMIAIDPDDLSLLPHHGLDTKAFLSNLVHAGDIRSCLTDVFVGGEAALRNRKLVRIDETEIRERVQRWERHAPPIGG